MVVDGFGLSLDDPSHQYVPGERISGKVFLKVSGVETTTELTVRFFGSVNTCWTEYKHDHKYSGFYTFDGHETPFDLTVRLLGDGVNHVRIPPGDNVFPFVFQVPVRPLPMTCTFEDGSVWYGVEGCIKRDWHSTDERTKLALVTIYSKVDLNLTPAAGNVMESVDAREVGGCCCFSKPCYLRSFTPRLGFCVGEVVPLVVEFDNKSMEPLNRISVGLHQIWTFCGRSEGLGMATWGDGGEHKTINNPLVTVFRSEDAGPKQVTRWEVPLTIPPTAAPTSVDGASELIKLEYVIDISAAAGSCCNDNFHVSHPIVVGTIPLISPSQVTVHIPKYNEKGGLA